MAIIVLVIGLSSSPLYIVMIHLVLFLLATCQSVVAVKNPACSSGVYSKLASYSSIKPVSSFCLSLYPPQTQTSTVSTTTTITTTSTLTT
jgi:hypothetical protein